MRIFSFLLLFAQVISFTPFIERFENWIQEFRIRFNNKHHFYEVLKKWMINDEYIDYINKQNLTYILGHNQFSGMDEFDFIHYVLYNSVPHVKQENE